MGNGGARGGSLLRVGARGAPLPRRGARGALLLRVGARGALLLLVLVGLLVISTLGTAAPVGEATAPGPVPLDRGRAGVTTPRVSPSTSRGPIGRPVPTPSSVATTSAPTVPPPAGLGPSSFVETWTVGPFRADKGAPIAESSPMVATLDGKGPAVVVGDRRGYLYAYHLSDGTPVAGWPAYDGGTPIDSTPSIDPSRLSGRDVVYVGAGNAAVPDRGGYEAFAPSGRRLWSTPAVDPPTDNHPAIGVQASLAVTSEQGRAVVFAGSLGQESYALNSRDGKALPGWPWFSADTVFSTAAVADLYGDGQTELVVGGASTAGVAYGRWYTDGGHLRILKSNGGLICHYDTNQEVDSSPAVGPFLAGGATGIVVGTGSYYDGVSDTARLLAFNDDCGLLWSDKLDGATSSSPALADIDGNGKLWAVEGTDRHSGGSVWVIDPATGAVRWKKPVAGKVIGSVVTADLSGLGYQDLLVPTVNGVEIMDGRSGAVVTVLPGGFQNSPLVTDDPNGTVGITLAGYNGHNEGVIHHYEIPGSNGAAAVGGGAWPMFHHDPQLSGTQQSTAGSGSTPCAAPAAAAPGYDLVASDGGVFSFGMAFCGSVRDPNRTAPIVGAAMAPGAGGYWLTSADGGVYAFGAARFYGSAAGARLARPVVGMAATPDGRGYWLVTSDGGVFTYGDAPYYGSAAGKSKFPVVGMAVTPDGRGYRLVTANGEVYCFGDARYIGGVNRFRLAHPVVGMATDRATGGYWLVDAGGGVFSFDAPFYGSTGNRRLAQPVKGIQSTGDGKGYWLVASDGGVSAFGDATFLGSASRTRLAAPVVTLIGSSG